MKSLLTIHQLTKQIDDFKLGPIDLTIEPGTITTIIGNNSSGKSSLLKLIMSLAKPDSGTITICDQPVNTLNENFKQDIAYQPQTTIGFDSFTGKQLNNFIARFYPNWDQALFLRVIQLLNIPLNQQYGKLSPGAKQKLSFALTIARNTSILLLDEPTAHVDIPAKKIMIDLIVEWMEVDYRAAIITSHQIEDIKKLSDYLFLLQDGMRIGHFEKEELIESYQRYWLLNPIPNEKIPGEVMRDGNHFVSNQPALTEQFLTDHHITWKNQIALELDEIITLLTNKEKCNTSKFKIRE